MRRSLAFLSLVLVGLAAAVAPALADEVVYIPKEKVAATIASAGSLDNGTDHSVSVSRRTGPGQAEVHTGETDVFYVLEGSATFVTGGTVIDGKTTAPGQIRGAGIEGGQTHMLSKGDVVVIPRGTPHWFKEVPQLVVYYVVKAK